MTAQKIEVTTTPGGQHGFSLTELTIALMVFTVVIGSVITLLLKSQTVFRTEQGVSEMDQNARLLIDFLTRDIQQSKENGLGLGPRFRSIYSHNGAEGKTDEVTIVSSDVETKIPAAALPLIPASTQDFSTLDHLVEMLPNGAGGLEPKDVVNAIAPDEEFIVSTVLENGSVQFDFIKVKGVRMNQKNTLEVTFDPVEHKGVQPQIPFGSIYENGAFTMRPVTIKRYFVDRKTDVEHPSLALSVNDGEPITIARNVVAFQLRYLEIKDGEVEGQWVQQQNIASLYKTQAVEVTMTARTEIEGDKQAERLVTLASVVRPRLLPSGDFGSSGGNRSPGTPTDGGAGGPGGGAGDGGPGGGGPGSGGPGRNGSGGNGGPGDGFGGPGGGSGYDNGNGGDGSGFQSGGYRHETRRIGRNPRLGERLNPRP